MPTMPTMWSSEWILAIAVAGLFGTFIGSFLNVCVHRLARNESVVTPGSRCYSCGTHVMWYDNLPIIGYIILGGRCRWCKTHFSMRYVFAEIIVGLLTAASVWWCLDFYLLFQYAPPGNELINIAPWLYTNWLSFATPEFENGVLGFGAMIAAVLVLVYYIYVSSLIDIDYRIIPDELTKGFQLLAPLLATFIPAIAHIQLQGHPFVSDAEIFDFSITTHFVWVCLGLLAFILLCIPCARFVFTRVVIESERWQDEDHKAFRTGVWVFAVSMILSVIILVIVDAMYNNGKQSALSFMIFRYSYMDAILGSFIGWILPYTVCIFGSAVFKRGAMGYGDVKFLAPIGAFVGPLGIIEVFFLAALYGTIIGLPLRLMGRDMRIPFGPYLALGAITTLLWGPQIARVMMPYLYL